jgi:hypothetical protein
MLKAEIGKCPFFVGWFPGGSIRAIRIICGWPGGKAEVEGRQAILFLQQSLIGTINEYWLKIKALPRK